MWSPIIAYTVLTKTQGMLRYPPPEFIQVTRPQRILLILKPDGVFANHSPVSENEQFLRHPRFFFGRPSRFPRLRALARLCTRSLRRILSRFAIVPRIDITASVKIPQESKYGSVKLR